MVKTTLNALDSKITKNLLTATGAFKTTPIDTLDVLAKEIKQQQRWDYLAFRYYCKIKSKISSPAHSHLILLSYLTLFRNKEIPQPLYLKIQDLLEKYKLRKYFIKPEFLYTFLNKDTPTWALDISDINLELNEHAKLVTPQARYRRDYNLLCQTMYSEHIKLYVNGSKI